MAEITAKLVMELRQRTGVGMMDCKKALAATDGDLEAAIEHLRKAGLAKAAKRAGRSATEGLIRIKRTDDRHAAMLVLNCETDFVARNEQFAELVDMMADVFATAELPSDCLGQPATEEHIQGPISGMKLADGQTISEAITAAVAKIGENIQLGQVVAERLDDELSYIQDYMHGNRVGVLVVLKTGKAETHASAPFIEMAKDLAMQVAAAMPRVPLSVDRDGLDQQAVEEEKRILKAQAEGEGKPPEIAEKMVMGRINKFFGEVCLLEQPYIRDDKQQVKAIVKAAEKETGDTIQVLRFHRFQLGE